MMVKYRKKPVVVEAVQLVWENWNAICDFIPIGSLKDGCVSGASKNYATGEPFKVDGPGLAVPTDEGLMIVEPRSWIVKSESGEIEYVKPDIFEATYEAVKEA